MTPKEEQNYKWDIETSWSQGFDKGKKETIAKLKEAIEKLEWVDAPIYAEDGSLITIRYLEKNEILKILEDIK